MAVIDINSLPTVLDTNLSDIFEVYTLSGDNIVPQIISFSDLSSFFSTNESFMELSAKYDELLSLMDSFKNFLHDNYPDGSQLSSILTTQERLSRIIAELQTINKTKTEILNEYATINYAELKKSESYSMHEKLANDMGSIRTSILGAVNIPEET